MARIIIQVPSVHVCLCVFAFLVLRLETAQHETPTHTHTHIPCDQDSTTAAHVSLANTHSYMHTCWSQRVCTTGLFCTSPGCATSHTKKRWGGLQDFYWTHRKYEGFWLRKMLCTWILMFNFVKHFHRPNQRLQWLYSECFVMPEQIIFVQLF